MTFLAPAFLWSAIAVAGGIVALHFIVTRQPRASVLPTARFVPDSPATAIVRDSQPADLLLMLLRVLIVLATGAALAKPVLRPNRQATGRVFLMDASRATAHIHEAADSVSALYREGDAVVVFDSAAHPLGPSARNSLAAVRRADALGNLSAALIAALREGSALRDRVDSVQLLIVSPLVADERNAATDSIRKLWPGRARLVHISATPVDSLMSDGKGDITLKSDSADPLAVTVSLAAKNQNHGSARVVRAAILAAEDSAWMVSANHVVVLWPALGRPLLAVQRSPADQSGGVAGRDLRLVSAFDRRWRFPVDSLRGARVTSRWADGEPAVVEKRIGRGCLKSVAIPVPVVGDLVIRPEFVRLVEVVTAPCGDPLVTTPLASSNVASLAGGGGLAPRDAFAARGDVASPLAPWLLGLALLAALVELTVRGFGGNGSEWGRDHGELGEHREKQNIGNYVSSGSGR